MPGTAINEGALCVRFGASRTPVREALLLLAAKGLVEILPRSGIYVRQLEARELVAGFWLWEVVDMDEAVAWVMR